MVNSISMSSGVIAVAKICDFVPIISTGSNIYALYKKHAYKKAEKESNAEITNSPCYTYLKNKSAKRCFLLMIPGFNIFFAIYFAAKGSKTKKTPVIVEPIIPIPDAKTPLAATNTTTTTTTSSVPTPAANDRVPAKIAANLAAGKLAAGKNQENSSSIPPVQQTTLAQQTTSTSATTTSSATSTSQPVMTPLAPPVPPAMSIQMTDVLSGNYELFLDESAMNGSAPLRGVVKNSNHWFKCIAVRSADLTKFSIYFDFYKIINPWKVSMEVAANNAVTIPKNSFDDVENRFNLAIKPAILNPLVTGIVAQKITP